MPEYILDTAGSINLDEPALFAQPGNLVAWRDLDAFTQGYIEALFFTSECPQVGTEEFRTAEHQSYMEAGRADGVLPCDVGFGDLSPEALQSIIADCQAFQEANSALLDLAYARDYDAAQAGRDYWFTRNGHGVGFWERKQLEPDSAEYERLTAIMVAASKSGDQSAWNDACAKRRALQAESIGDKLSAACRYSEVNPYFGEDGRVHLD